MVVAGPVASLPHGYGRLLPTIQASPGECVVAAPHCLKRRKISARLRGKGMRLAAFCQAQCRIRSPVLVAGGLWAGEQAAHSYSQS
jgi:hypothetical protein